jgi:hypothetical protein
MMTGQSMLTDLAINRIINHLINSYRRVLQKKKKMKRSLNKQSKIQTKTPVDKPLLTTTTKHETDLTINGNKAKEFIITAST